MFATKAFENGIFPIENYPFYRSPIYRILLSLSAADFTSSLLSVFVIYGTFSGHVGRKHEAILIYYVRTVLFLEIE